MSDTRIPLDQAVKQVAAQTGLPESKIREYAQRMRAGGDGIRSAGAGAAAVGPGLLMVMQRAAEIEEQKARTSKMAWIEGDAPITANEMRKALSGVELANRRVLDMSPFARRVSIGGAKAPRNERDRRTFRVLGKPYHFAETAEGRLRIQPGESPWT